MNNAELHVCVSIIQTNHYIYSIISIMNYSPECSMFGCKNGCWVFWTHTDQPVDLPGKQMYLCVRCIYT